ncbi:major facilitator superfamily domain-containing protein [Abortiporus biennis]|nr:major facilitator superfamily domain-containing protein [Abortiporus biennis]
MSGDPTPQSAPLSPAPTLLDESRPPRFSSYRKYTLLAFFCAAQFLDSFNNSSLFSAIPTLIDVLDITEGESTWIISAFQLTFAAFLLISGRISDIYNPKYAFIVGVAVLGIFSIAAGFVHDKISLIVLRALSGIFVSLTIPSALTLLVNLFPEQAEQARALGIFGGCGSIGGVLGLIIGAIFVEFATWKWVFWFVAVISIPIAAACVILIPKHTTNSNHPTSSSSAASRLKSLDLLGVTTLTAALILFIFAVTSASDAGWGTAKVLAPLIISIFMVAGFFFYETVIPPEVAAVPPRTWFLPNFAVLFGVALLPYFWWSTAYTTYTTLWQTVYGWSVISMALRMIPMGFFSLVVSFSGSLTRIISPKWILMFAQVLLMVSTILEAFTDSPHKYWSFVFPAFILGTSGAMFTYTHTFIAIFRATPSSMAGTVGAIFNCALQLGSAIGLAVDISIQTSVETRVGDPTTYKGKAASFWFLFAIICIEFFSILVFYRVDVEKKDEENPKNPEKEKVPEEATESKILSEKGQMVEPDESLRVLEEA